MTNQKFLNKALELLPDLIQTETHVAKTVIVERCETGEVKVIEDTDYNKQHLKKGNRVCLDFGNHQVGYLSLKLQSYGSHADAPVWMKLHFAENPAELLENPKEYNGWICSSWIEEEQVHIDVIPSEYQFQRRYSFRYVEIEILDISNKFDLIIENAVCTAVSSADDNKIKSFIAKNELHQKLDRIACRTLHNCMQKVFEDGPKRDRRLWLGDLRIQALANYETYQNNNLVKACLYLFAALTMEDGLIGACIFLDPVPEVDDTQMFDYSLFFISTLLDYYQETKDLETLKELWPTALSQIYLAEQQIGHDGIVKDSNVLGWCFVDWNLKLNKQASAQGVFMYAVLSAMKIAEILGEEAEQKRLRDLYDICKNSANEILWDEESEVYVSGEKRQISYASQVWMILGGAITGTDAAELLRHVESVENVLEMVTPYMYHNYIDALILSGEKKKACEKLEEYWGGMAAQGADTFWELYNPKNPLESPYGGTIVNSYCHAWSCAPAYFLRKYFGTGEQV